MPERVESTRLTISPKPVRLLEALLLALAGSLALDALLIALGTAAFPAMKGYGHFHFSDYGLLTIVGVVMACAAWMVIARLTSEPRRVLFRLAVAVTIVLLLPDVWLLIRDEPPAAVTILMCMHLGIALVTYNALVHVAPARVVPPDDATKCDGGEGATGDRGIDESSPAGMDGAATSRVGHWVWILMMTGLGVESALGIGALVVVPLHRSSSWIPGTGAAVYLIHAVLGKHTLVAMWLVTLSPPERIVRAGTVIGLAGLALGAGGGVLAVYPRLDSPDWR